MAKNTICLWYDKDAEAAARFYAETFPDSAVGAVHRAPSDFPSGKKGDVLTVEFTVAGVACIGLNGGPAFKHNEAFSFQIATDDQQETDRYWNAIVGNGGQESACGWCKDKWGISWQITPRVLTEALAAGGDEAKRAFDAMMGMKKIDVAAIKAARPHGRHRSRHERSDMSGPIPRMSLRLMPRYLLTSPAAPADNSAVAPAESTGRRAGADRQVGCLGSPNCAEKRSRSRSRRRSQPGHWP